MKRTAIRRAVVLLMAFVTVLGALPQASAQGPAPATLPVTKETVSTIIQKNETPRIAISASQIHVTWKGGPPKKSYTSYSERAEDGTTWPPQQRIGGQGDGTYLTSSVAVSPVDNSVHLVWSDTSQGGNGYMFYSRHLGGDQWTTPLRISKIGRFAHYPHATVDAQGRIWAIWSAENPSGNDNIYYRYSDDNGASWQPSSEGLLDNNNAKRPWIAADKNGGVHAVWWRYDGGVYYGYWNGSRWSIHGIPSGGYNADPSVTVDIFDNVHVVWRRQRAFGAWDVYYATHPVGASSWSIQKLYSGDNVNKTVPIFADEQGTLHVAWFDDAGGSNIWYTNKPAGGNWLSPPVNVSMDGGLFNTNPDVVGRTNGDGQRAHVVFETWYGGDSDVRVEHSLVGQIVPPPEAQPVINGVTLPDGRKGTKDASLSVSFAGVSGGPDQVRYNFGSPPTADDWKSLGPLSIPNDVASGDCATLTLYTQVRNSVNGKVQPAAASATILVDRGVQASAFIHSRKYPGGSDANYINVPNYVYSVNPEPSNCAGVASYQALNTSPADPAHPGSDTKAHLVDIPTPQQGNVSAIVRVTDAVGNIQNFNTTLVYDTQPPTVTNGNSFNTTNNSGDDPIATLSFPNVLVSDTLYNFPGPKDYWGVEVLVAGQDLGNTPSDDQFAAYGAIVEVPRYGTTAEVSLINKGIPANGKTMTSPGQRFIYLRFLDGAGNASTTILKDTLTLDQNYTQPTLYLPAVMR